MTNARQLDFSTPFAAFVETRRLANFVEDKNFLAAFASSNMKILPYQIAAARFALRSHYLKGCILCDEGSLGKTYEALLIIAQKWYEGKSNILIVLPQNLITQWMQKIEEGFTLPISLWQEENADKAIHIISYDKAVKYADMLEQTNWDLVVFDEADFLFKPENKSVIALKKMVGDAFKLLLTPTPITLTIMDIYGLIHFIDEDLLPDKDEFYKRYFRKPENYGELADWVSKFAYRTLKKQVSQYAKFTDRIPYVLNYSLTDAEKELYQLTDKYLKLANKTAYPEMDNYQLTLQFYHTLSSSPQAFANMLKAPIERADGDERVLLQELQNKAAQITINGKMADLVKALKKVFAHLKSRKENQKALIFVDNLISLEVLADVLAKDFTLTQKLDEFRNDKNIQILLTNDETAKGLDVEFCPVVVNYDLLYNAVLMEQRICRCHRQGQESDVLVINMLSPDNFSDVRILELINKRLSQLGGIFGLSDNIVGNFEASLEDILQKRRLPADIQSAFNEALMSNQTENEHLVEDAEAALFTTFTKSISDKITVSPKYIEEQAEQIQKDLWPVVRYYFQTHCPDYVIDDEAQTLTLPEDKEPPHLFYYMTGGQNRPHFGKRAYGMAKDFKPAFGRITLTSILANGIFREIKAFEEGSITVAADIEPCEIGFYHVELRSGKKYLTEYDILTGKTKSGRVLSDKECREILSLPVKEYQTGERSTPYWLATCNGASKVNVDSDLQAVLIEPYLNECQKSCVEDIDLIKLQAGRKKTLLEQSLAELRKQVKKTKDTALGVANDRLAELQAQKQINNQEKELKKKEESLFLEQMKIDVNMEEEIESLTAIDKIFINRYVIFNVKVKSNSSCNNDIN